MWCLDHLADLESDFSVFHRVEDLDTLDGPRFFRLAYRIAAYQGVMAAVIAEQEAQHRPPAQQAPTQVAAAGPATLPGGRSRLTPEESEANLMTLRMAGLIERRSASGK